MGEKKTKNKGEKKIDNPQSNDGGKDGDILTVVLKVDLHCEGCCTKIKKSIRAFEGVESVKGGYGESNKLTVAGTFDPVKLREMVEKKANTKVELLSAAAPKKDKESSSSSSNKAKDKDGGGGGGEKKTGDKTQKNPDDNKSKEPPVTTAVMKVDLHCEGCIQKIRKTVIKTKGYNGISIDEQKNLVTVKGTMDMKALAESLKEKLKKPVEIVQPKKEAGGKKGKGGGDGDSGGGGGNDAGGGKCVDENRIQFVQYGHPNPPMYEYGSGYPIEHFSAPASQMFSDENPNACSIM